MDVTRDVILDLLPLYLADEASADTKALVSAHLDRDPELAALARSWRERLPAPPPARVDPDAQAKAFHQAQRLILIRTLGLASLITFGTLALIALLGAMYVFLR